MIKKIMIGMMVLSIMLVMVGTAAANQISLYESDGTTEVSSIEIPTGGSVDKLIKISAFQVDGSTNNVNHYLYDTVYDKNSNVVTDISITYQEVNPNIKPWGPEKYLWVQEAGIGGSETLNIKFTVSSSVLPGSTYTVYIYDENTGLPVPIVLSVMATSQITEFPTVALPIAAVLGLMFIISSRKKKE